MEDLTQQSPETDTPFGLVVNGITLCSRLLEHEPFARYGADARVGSTARILACRRVVCLRWKICPNSDVAGTAARDPEPPFSLPRSLAIRPIQFDVDAEEGHQAVTTRAVAQLTSRAPQSVHDFLRQHAATRQPRHDRCRA